MSGVRTCRVTLRDGEQVEVPKSLLDKMVDPEIVAAPESDDE